MKQDDLALLKCSLLTPFRRDRSLGPIPAALQYTTGNRWIGLSQILGTLLVSTSLHPQVLSAQWLHDVDDDDDDDDDDTTRLVWIQL